MKRLLVIFAVSLLPACGGGSSSGGGGFDGIYRGERTAVPAFNGKTLKFAWIAIIQGGMVRGLHSGNTQGSACSPTVQYPVTSDGTFQFRHTVTCAISGDVCDITYSGAGTVIPRGTMIVKGAERWSCAKTGGSSWTDFWNLHFSEPLGKSKLTTRSILQYQYSP